MAALYKVLLVDDEDLDLAGLERLIDWQGLGMEVAAAVNSGFAALEFIRSRKDAIDLVVTDIKMPIMSGLEFTRQAIELLPDLKVLYVSGYEDFHYARQAIQMNASGYILKPIDDEEMNRVLLEMKAELDREREQKAVEHALQGSIPLVRNELLLRIVEGQASGPVLTELLERARLSWQPGDTCIAVLEIDDLSWKLNRYDESQRSELLGALHAYIADWCEDSGIVACKAEAHRLILFTSRDRHLGQLELFVHAVRERFPLTVTIGIGPAAQRAEELQASYAAAAEALGSKMFLGKSRIIRHSDTKLGITRSAKDLDVILDEIFTAMTQYELVRIDDHITELFTLVAKLDSRLSVYPFSLHVIARLDSYLRDLNENLYHLLGIEMKDLDIVFHFETADDIQSWLRRRLFELSDLLRMKRQKKNRKLIEEVDRYIGQNLASNVTLRDAANHFSFSPNHLGYLFKEGTGMNFSDYVIGVRLKRAKKLLRDPKMKIYEVAEQVGYRNLAYFSKQFRETFGMTPGEYRKQV